MGSKVVGKWLTTPRSAVIAVYAQDRGDYNTWDYEARYGDLVKTGEWHVFCGHMVAPTYSLKKKT